SGSFASNLQPPDIVYENPKQHEQPRHEQYVDDRVDHVTGGAASEAARKQSGNAREPPLIAESRVHCDCHDHDHHDDKERDHRGLSLDRLLNGHSSPWREIAWTAFNLSVEIRGRSVPSDAFVRTRTKQFRGAAIQVF